MRLLKGYIGGVSSYSQKRQDLADHLKLGSISTWSTYVFLEAAHRLGLGISRSKSGTWFVSDGSGRRFSYRIGETNWNVPLASKIARHKDVTSRYLIASGIPAPKNQIFSGEQIEQAWQWGQPFQPLVVKPATGLRGRNVHVDIGDKEKFVEAFQDVAANWESQVLVEKFYTGNEHRCLIVAGKFVAATRRRPASVLGDGTSTLNELVLAKNSKRTDVHYRLQLGSREIQELSERGLTPKSVIPEGRRVFLTQISNLQFGGDAIDATSKLSAEEIAVCEKVAGAFPGARLIGIDVLLPRTAGDDEMCILEVNLRPEIAMHYFPYRGQKRDVGKLILEAMFPSVKNGTGTSGSQL